MNKAQRTHPEPATREDQPKLGSGEGEEDAWIGEPVCLECQGFTAGH